MPTQPSRGPEIAIRQFRGINLRKSKSQLDEGECDRNFGVYPGQVGLLQRIPGKTPMRVFEDDTTPRKVYQAAQTFDGTGNVIIQNGDSISVYTLDELQNRVTTTNLTPGAVPAGAIIGLSKPNKVAGGSFGASINVFYDAPIANIITDGGSVIVSTNGTTFQLGAGTYRIRAAITISSYFVYAAKAALYNITRSAFQTQAGTSLGIYSLSGRYTGTNPGNQTLFMYGRFTISAAVETLSIRLTGINSNIAFPSAPNALGSAATGVSGETENYTFINIYRE